MLKKIKHFFKYINIHQRMLLIYLLGGMLPLVTVAILMIFSTSTILTKQARDSEQTELYLIQTTISENLRIVTDVSLKMYFDEKLENIAFTIYEDYSDYFFDYKNYDTINEYLDSYTHDIQAIHVYIDNPTIGSSSRFIPVNNDVRKTIWYKEAVRTEGNAKWYYLYDEVNFEYYLTLVRLLRTDGGRPVGVLQISSKNDLVNELINSRQYDTSLILDNETIVATNSSDLQEKELLELVKTHEGNLISAIVDYGGESCVLTICRLDSDVEHGTNQNTLTLVSIHPYSDILKEVSTQNTLSIAIVTLSSLFSLIIIISFSLKLSKRISNFKDQMHKVANGDFDIQQKIGGHDEISELYYELHTMIDSIQHLQMAVIEEKLQKEQLNSRQKDVEFKMLASQINPHFLYNTLETIRMKARVNEQPEIEELVKMLAKIMRRNIQVGDNLVSFKSEMDLVEYYLKIQQYRFGDRIKYNININADIDKYKIMPLLIQPIVENAFVHGLEQKENGGVIDITVRMDTDMIITVEDNGCGMTEEELEEIKRGLDDFAHLDRIHIGLCNVNQRIKLLYGDSYGIMISSTKNVGTTVTLRLPDKVR